MALRTRRAWSVLRAQIRRILLETDSSNSFWSDTLLLDLVNHAIEQRSLELGESHEGWIRQAYLADTVADQREYALPEGIERVRAVFQVFSSSGGTEEIQLNRNDRIGEDYYEPASSTSVRGGRRPEYRLLDNLLLIEPPDPETRTNGLRLEVDALPPLITGDSDEISLLFPLSTETLLVYDVVMMAIGVEDSQGNQDDSRQGHSQLKAFHRRLEASWRAVIAVRNQSRVYGPAFNLGD